MLQMRHATGCASPRYCDILAASGANTCCLCWAPHPCPMLAHPGSSARQCRTGWHSLTHSLAHQQSTLRHHTPLAHHCTPLHTTCSASTAPQPPPHHTTPAGCVQCPRPPRTDEPTPAHIPSGSTTHATAGPSPHASTFGGTLLCACCPLCMSLSAPIPCLHHHLLLHFCYIHTWLSHLVSHHPHPTYSSTLLRLLLLLDGIVPQKDFFFSLFI